MSIHSDKMSHRGYLVPMGDSAGERRELNATTVIGRDPESCHILIADPLCSRTHCHISRTPSGEFRLVDVATRNGTRVNGEKISECILQNGDVIKIGNSAWRFTVELPQPTSPKKSWLVPERRGYRYLQLVVTLLLVGTLFAFPFDDGSILPYWGETFSNLWARLTRRIERPDNETTPAVADRATNIPVPQSPEASGVLQPATDKMPPSADLRHLSQQGFDALVRDVRDALSAKEWDKAKGLVDSFKQSSLSGGHALGTFALDRSIADARREYEQTERQRLAEIERRWKGVEERVKTLIAEERFDDASAILRDCDDRRATALAAVVESARREYVAVTLPRRRELQPRVYLAIRPHLAKRDYAQAIAALERMKSDAVFAVLRADIAREIEQIKVASEVPATAFAAVAALPKMTALEFNDRKGNAIAGKLLETKDVGEIVLTIPGSSGERMVKIGEVSTKDIVTWATLDAGRPDFRRDDSAPRAESARRASPVSRARALFCYYDGAFGLFMEEIAGDREMDERDRRRLLGKVERVANALCAKEIEEAQGDQGRLRAIGKRYEGFPLAESVAAMLASVEATAADPTVAKHIRVLRDPASSTEAKTSALGALRLFKNPAARDAIVASLDDPSAVVRLKAGEALTEYGDAASMFIALRLLGDPVYEVGARMARVLALRAPKEMVAELKRRLTSKDPDERRIAVVALGILDPERENVAGNLASALGDPDPRVRRAAATALIRLGDANKSTGALTNRLKVEEDEGVMSALIAALGFYKAKSAGDEIRQTIEKHPGSIHRPDWIRALGETGNGGEVRKLLPLLKDESPWIRNAVAEAMAEADAPVKGTDVRHLLADDLAINRAAAVRILGKIGDNDGLKTILGALSDPEEVVRTAGSMALWGWEKPDIVPAMIDALDKVGGGEYAEVSAILRDLTGQKIKETDPAKAKELWTKWWLENRAKFRLPKRT